MKKHQLSCVFFLRSSDIESLLALSDTWKGWYLEYFEQNEVELDWPELNKICEAIMSPISCNFLPRQLPCIGETIEAIVHCNKRNRAEISSLELWLVEHPMLIWEMPENLNFLNLIKSRYYEVLDALGADLIADCNGHEIYGRTEAVALWLREGGGKNKPSTKLSYDLSRNVLCTSDRLTKFGKLGCVQQLPNYIKLNGLKEFSIFSEKTCQEP